MLPLIRLPFAAFTLLASPVVSTDNFSVSSKPEKRVLYIPPGTTHDFSASIEATYNNWQLRKTGMSTSVFAYAIKGYRHLLKSGRLGNSRVITIADFSKASTQKRLYILDVTTGNMLCKTWVAHGLNSGQLYARSFSNQESSLKSSPGFYITSQTYIGKNGYSLLLEGCEKAVNDNAHKRAIVMHGAPYVSKTFIQQHGFLGRSHGCPAVPEELSRQIIETIKGGSCLFIYAPEKKYLSQSPILNAAL